MEKKSFPSTTFFEWWWRNQTITNGSTYDREMISGKMIGAQWARSTKNPDVSTGPFARPFSCSLAPLTGSLAPPCLLCSRAPLRSAALRCAHWLARSLTLLAPSLVGQWLIRWLFILCFFLFWPIVHWLISSFFLDHFDEYLRWCHPLWARIEKNTE